MIENLASICDSCGSTDPAKMGGSSPCRNSFHVGFPRDPSDNGPVWTIEDYRQNYWLACQIVNELRAELKG